MTRRDSRWALPIFLVAVSLGATACKKTGGPVDTSTAPPVIVGVTPAGPANDNAPVVTGTAPAGRAIQLFSDANCDVTLAGASGEADANGDFSITVTVEDDSVTSIYGSVVSGVTVASDCSSTFVTYVEDSTAPAAPVITSTRPGSPGALASPVVVGTAEADAHVAFYADEGCRAALGDGDAGTDGAFEFSVTVATDTTTSFYGTATDLAGNTSACTDLAFVYEHLGTPPADPVLVDTLPASPADDLAPLLRGNADPDTLIHVHLDAACSAAVATDRSDSAGAFAIAVQVDEDATTALYAQAENAAGVLSTCVGPLIYVEDSTAPLGPVVTGITPTGPANDNQPVITGTSEADATVVFYSDSNCTTPLGSGSADGSGAFSVTLTVPDDSTTALFAIATDAAGHDSPCTQGGLEYIEDSLAPEAPLVTSTDPVSPSTSDAPTLWGTAEAGAAVAFYSDGSCTTALGSGLADNVGGFAIPISVPSDTTTVLYATATDAAGNASACVDTNTTYVHDGTAPGLPSGLGLTPSGPSNDETPTIAGTTEAGAAVAFYPDFLCSSTSLGSGPADSGGAFSFDLTVPENATTNLYVLVTDALGNVSSCLAVGISYVEDSTAPGAPTLSGLSPPGPSPDETPTVAGTTEADATVSFYGDAVCTAGLGSGTADTGGAFSFDLTVPQDTTTSLYVVITDTLGNASACLDLATTYVEDSTAPAPPALTALSPPGPSNDETPTASGIAEAGASVAFYSDSTCTALLGTGTADGGGAFTFDLTVPENTTTALYALASDSAGNTSACTDLATSYVEDSTPPTAPTITGFVSGNPSSDQTPTVTGTAEAGAIIVFYSDNACSTSLGAGAVSGTGDFSFDLTVPENTTTTLYAVMTDLQANTSTCLDVGTSYVEDSIAPALPVLTGTTPASGGFSGTPTIDGTSEPGATVQVFNEDTCINPVGTGVADGSGNFAVTVSVAPGATVPFWGQARDAAGNVSACSTTTVSYSRSSSSPAFAFPTWAAFTDAATITVRGYWDGAPAGLAWLRVGGVDATTTDGYANWVAKDVPLVMGTNTLGVSFEDGSGNVNTDVITTTVTRETFVEQTFYMAWDDGAGRVYFTDYRRHELWSYELATGVRALVSGPTRGTGTGLTSPSALTIDGSRALVITSTSVVTPNRRRLMAVDLTTGNRTTVSDSTVGTGTNPSVWVDLTVDGTNGRALVTDSVLDALFAVDLATGNRTLLSDDTHSGPTFDLPSGVSVSADGQKAWVAEDRPNGFSSSETVLVVDLTTGNRSYPTCCYDGSQPQATVRVGTLVYVADNNCGVYALDTTDNSQSTISTHTALSSCGGTKVGTGTSVYDVRSIAYDSSGARLLLFGQGSIYAVDPTTGNRVELTYVMGTGPGPRLVSLDVALDTNGGLAYLTALSPARVVELNLATGTRATIADVDIGAGNTASGTGGRGITYDANTGLVYYVPNQDLVELDPQTWERWERYSGSAGGNPSGYGLVVTDATIYHADGIGTTLYAFDRGTWARTVVSSAANAGPTMDYMMGLALDAANNQLILGDMATGFVGELMTVDLTTGDRKILSDSVTGTGFIWGNGVDGLAFDGTTIVTSDYWYNNYDSIVTVDPSTGNRTVVSGGSPTLGKGPALWDPGDPVFDSTRGTVIVVSGGWNGVLQVDLETGERVIVAR